MMCWKCAMRAAAQGDEEAMLTLEALADPQMMSGLALMVGAMMNRFDLDEFTMDPNTFDEEAAPALSFERNGQGFLIARRVKKSEIPATIELARAGEHTVN